MSMLLSLVFMHCVFSSIEDSSNSITCEITVYMLAVFLNPLRFELRAHPLVPK